MASIEEHPLSTVARPKQARSQKTLERILDAAEALIIEKGHQNVSVADVARRAKSSVGGFYARFRDKEALLLALHERSLTKIAALVERLSEPSQWEGASLEDTVHDLLGHLVREFRERRRLIAAFVASVTANPAGWRDAIVFRRRVVDAMTALVLTKRSEIRHPDPERAVELGVQMIFAITDQQVLNGFSHGGQLVDDETLAAELERVFLAYLGVAPGAGRP